MKLTIPRDYFSNPTPPIVYLCTQGGAKIQEIPAYETTLNAKWNSWSELNFTFDRHYVDIITGETRVHPAFDKAEGLRKVLVNNMGYFIIQDPDTLYTDKDSKTISAFSAEYALGNKFMNNWYINTGEIDSKEVIYYADQHGGNTDINDYGYKLSLGEFDPHKRYYIQEKDEKGSFKYVPTQIEDEEDYNSHFGEGINAYEPLYITDYERVIFYDPIIPELSLVHLILQHIPDWKLGDVDVILRAKHRTFSEERISVYDFLTNKMADTFKCIVSFDTLTKTISFYEEADDGLNEDGTVKSQFETDVYISRENLANEIKISYSADDLKTKLKVSGGDDIDIREINLGSDYIMNLDYYHNLDWMEQDLFDGYDDYLDAIDEYTPQFNDAAQNWNKAYNQQDKLMNTVPIEGNVVRVGDDFKKLYCLYTPTDTAYIDAVLIDDYIGGRINDLYQDKEFTTLIDERKLKPGDTFIVQGYQLVYRNEQFEIKKKITNDEATKNLRKQLNLYHVDDDIGATNKDNILLRLKNDNSDVATIRIYDPKIKDPWGQFDDSMRYYTKKETLPGKPEYIRESISSDTYKANTYYVNNYKIHILIVRDASGLSETPIERDLSDWIQGFLSTDNNTIRGLSMLEGFKVSYIGTMGAYFVLAKDESIEENLQDYGVNLLKSKKEVYRTIHQTQLEGMFAQQNYQCITSSVDPSLGAEGVPLGTKWLDTSVSPVILKTYIGVEGNLWNIVENEDLSNYENYSRFKDNYDKMKAVETILAKKEKDAGYYSDGYAIDTMSIYVDKYQSGIGQSLESDMMRVAQQHFVGASITKINMDTTVPIYQFVTSADPLKYKLNTESFDEEQQYYINNGSSIYTAIIIENEDEFNTYDELYILSSGHIYAVYLKGTTPYVAYATSQGVYQAQKDYYTKLTQIENFLNDDQLARLSPLINEDEFSDDNFFLTDYDSEQTRLEICNELLEEANKELKTLSQPRLEFSMSMGNILALPEFEPIISQFALGHFIRIELRPGLVKKARLLEVSLNFDDLSDFSCNFGNLVTTKSEIDLHAELLSQAMSAGKQVARSSSNWQKAVDKSNRLEQAIADGLADATLEVGRANGQSIVWDDGGIWGRKLLDGTTDQYDPEQFRIINNKLLFSNDGFETTKALFGEYTINDETRWGVLAEYVTANTIEGKFISGGSIEIGEGDTKFIVNTDGSVEIKTNGQDKYASSSALDVIDDAYRYQTILTYDRSTIFSDINDECIITCDIYDNRKQGTDKSVTQVFIDNGATFVWSRSSFDGDGDQTWTPKAYTDLKKNQIRIKPEDVTKNAQFSCDINIDENVLKILQGGDSNG